LVATSSAVVAVESVNTVQSTAIASIAAAYFKTIAIDKSAAPVTAANTAFNVTLTNAVKDAADTNVLSVKINGISLNFDSALANGWDLSAATTVAIKVPYALDAIDVIEVHYLR